MIGNVLFPRPEVHQQWRRAIVLLTTTLLSVHLFVWGCAFRVARAAPLLQARFSLSVAGRALQAWLAGACTITLLFLMVDRLARWGTSSERGRRWFRAAHEPGSEGEAVFALAGALLLIPAAWVALSWLDMPFSWNGRPVAIPLIATKAARYLWPVAEALLLEAGLALAWLLRGQGIRWWLVRAVTGVAWCLLILWVVTGPNLLVGDPLEWAQRLGGSGIPQDWLNRAPRVLGTWWPVIQVGLAGSLMVAALAVAKEIREAWRGAREKRGAGNVPEAPEAAAPGPPDADSGP